MCGYVIFLNNLVNYYISNDLLGVWSLSIWCLDLVFCFFAVKDYRVIEYRFQLQLIFVVRSSRVRN